MDHPTITPSSPTSSSATHTPDFETLSQTHLRVAITQNPGQKDSIETFAIDTTDENDKANLITTTDGMCYEFLTIGRLGSPSATKEDFLRRAEPNPNRKKTLRKRGRSQALSTDTLYSKLVEQQAQAKARYQEEPSLYQELSPRTASPFQNLSLLAP
ncbi:hypothetical protein CRG98_002377 [Punica granatum]|uniref:Uncharacterized protein n=1 Tax=Punica granatum TaxID=22663 RepID=A0A2I0LAP9_PUNGR|nr:hypothetical protein CRG98_002377 [Punica granatum]